MQHEEDYEEYIDCLKKVSYAYTTKNQAMMDANIYIVKSLLKNEKVAIIFPMKNEKLDNAENFYYTKDGKIVAFTCDEELEQSMMDYEYSYVAYLDDLTKIFSVTKKKLILLDKKMTFPYLYPLFSLI